MVPPVWRDEFGQPRAVRPCSHCGRDAPLYRFRLEHLRMIGWHLYVPAAYVNWCGHAQEFELSVFSNVIAADKSNSNSIRAVRGGCVD
jgi:hypothetical protein